MRLSDIKINKGEQKGLKDYDDTILKMSMEELNELEYYEG